MFKKQLFNIINGIGASLPKKIQRRIADFPGVLTYLEKFSQGTLNEITTPEGYRLAINTLFHSNLVRLGDLDGYETEIRNAVTSLTRPGMVAYDIGANVGIFSFLFASLTGDDGIVYAFEPEKNNFSCFEKSLEINDITNLILDKRAIGKARSTERFDRRGGAFSGRLVGEDATYDTTDNIEIVETVSVDFLIEQENYRVPDIVKIDVEGNEGLVFEGMQTTLRKHAPIIICELHTHLGESSQKVIQMLSSYGYTISDVHTMLSGAGSGAALSDVSKERHIIATKKQ